MSLPSNFHSAIRSFWRISGPAVFIVIAGPAISRAGCFLLKNGLWPLAETKTKAAQPGQTVTATASPDEGAGCEISPRRVGRFHRLSPKGYYSPFVARLRGIPV